MVTTKMPKTIANIQINCYKKMARMRKVVMPDYDIGYHAYRDGFPYDTSRSNDWMQGWADAEDGCYQDGDSLNFIWRK